MPRETPSQSSMFTKDGKVKPELAIEIALQKIKAQMEAQRASHLANLQNSKKTDEDIEERSKNHSH